MTYGAAALFVGFSFQALGYLIRVSESRWLAIVVVGLILLSGTRAATKLAWRGLPRHVWYPSPRPHDAIADGLTVYGVGNISDLERVVTRSLVERTGSPVEPISERSTANVIQGTWTVYCPRCHQPTSATTPEWGQAICTECGAKYGVKYPDAEACRIIEADLLAEPDPDARRWIGT